MEFELADLIRVNQLVRGRIDFEEFHFWYASLPPEQRRALTNLLCEFAYQAGVDHAIWDQALTVSGQSADDPVVQQVFAICKIQHPEYRLYELVMTVPENELPTVFRLFVYLYGTAEGKVFRSEPKESCNHWWHRDLLDERVVRDLLENPKFYMTSRKDDDRIKEHS